LRDVQTKAPECAEMVESTLERSAGIMSGKYENYRVLYPSLRWDESL